MPGSSGRPVLDFPRFGPTGSVHGACAARKSVKLRSRRALPSRHVTPMSMPAVPVGAQSHFAPAVTISRGTLSTGQRFCIEPASPREFLDIPACFCSDSGRTYGLIVRLGPHTREAVLSLPNRGGHGRSCDCRTCIRRLVARVGPGKAYFAANGPTRRFAGPNFATARSVWLTIARAAGTSRSLRMNSNTKYLEIVAPSRSGWHD